MASRGSTDHTVQMRRSTPGNESFFISHILLLGRARVMVWLGSVLERQSVQAPGCCMPPCWPYWVTTRPSNDHTLLPQLSQLWPLYFRLSPPHMHCSVTPSFPPSQHISIHCSDIGSCNVSHSIFFSPNSFMCKCSLQWVFDLVQGFWFLTHHQYWTILEAPFKYPAVVQSHRDPVALVLQDLLLHKLHQHIDGVDVGVVWFKVPDLGLEEVGWGWAELVSVGACFPTDRGATMNVHYRNTQTSMSLLIPPRIKQNYGRRGREVEGWGTLKYYIFI